MSSVVIIGNGLTPEVVQVLCEQHGVILLDELPRATDVNVVMADLAKSEIGVVLPDMPHHRARKGKGQRKKHRRDRY